MTLPVENLSSKKTSDSLKPVGNPGESCDRESRVTEETPCEHLQKPIIFFDGVCGLCNHFVDFVLRQDRKQRFLFAALQGETAKRILDKRDAEDLKSIVLRQHGTVYRHSAAVVRVLWGLSFLWRIAGGLLWIIPGPLRNFGYRIVAKARYQMFGKKTTCRVPGIEERARFLP